MKKTVYALFIFLALTGCGAINEPPQTDIDGDAQFIDNPEITVTGGALLDEVPVTRAVAAKMITLTTLSAEDILLGGTGATFNDINENEWYTPYVAAAKNSGYVEGDGGLFMPEKPLTVSEAQSLMDKLNPNNKIAIKITEENKNLPISYALWGQLFMRTATELAGGKTIEEAFSVKQINIIPLLTSSHIKELPPWSMVTDKGPYFFKGLNMDAYIDKKISVFVKNNEILLINDVVDESPVIEGAYILEGSDNGVKIFAGGAQKFYRFSGNTDGVTVGDIQVSGGEILSIIPPTGIVSGKVTKLTNEYIEVADTKIDRSVFMPVYQKDENGVLLKKVSDLIPGANDVTIYIKDGLAAAVLLNKQPPPQYMRVLINGGLGRVHESVEIASGGGFTVTEKGGARTFAQGETFVVSADTEFPPSGKIYVKADGDDGFLHMSSSKGNGVSAKYRGTLEISKTSGGLEIVNELLFEQYLYAVVSAQMPEHFGLTALKAQSVVARTAALNAFYENMFAEYGANTDDSTASQQYGGLGENAVAVRAVTETNGKVIKKDGETIRPAFFYSSGGYTANSGEVWSSGEIFPAETRDYLRAAPQFTKGDYGDLTKSSDALKFYKNTNVSVYEKSSPWARWNFTMSYDEITASVNANISARYNAYPSQVLTLEDGKYIRKPVDAVGRVTSLEVVKRGEGGIVTELKIVCEKGEYLLVTGGSVQTVIRPVQLIEGSESIMLNLLDGSAMADEYVMPSVFFAIEQNESGMVTFYGGGKGHGVGMSQYGAKVLGDEGFSYEDIISHYYNESVVVDMK